MILQLLKVDEKKKKENRSSVECVNKNYRLTTENDVSSVSYRVPFCRCLLTLHSFELCDSEELVSIYRGIW